MLSKVDELNADIATQKALIAENDKQIEDAEHRRSLRRRHGDSLFRRLLQLERFLERETATVQKPTGSCVTEVAPDGVHWNL